MGLYFSEGALSPCRVGETQGKNEARAPELHVGRPVGPENKMLKGLGKNTVSGPPLPLSLGRVHSRGSTVSIDNQNTEHAVSTDLLEATGRGRPWCFGLPKGESSQPGGGGSTLLQEHRRGGYQESQRV